MKNRNTTFCIIGAGAAGISMAKLLQEKGYNNITIFEKNGRIGGKSLSIEHEGLVHELGTCYAAYGYEQVFKWMDEVGITKINNEPAQILGADFRHYAYNGKSKLQALRELTRYTYFWNKFQRGRMEPEQYSRLTLEWLEDHRFDIITRIMHRGMTTMGYGFLDEVPLYHTFQWMYPSMILFGAVNAVYEPVEGWQSLWQRLANSMNIHLNCPVEYVNRRSGKPRVATPLGSFQFDEVILALPLDQASFMLELIPQEESVINAIYWGALKATLITTQEWYKEESIRIYHPQVVSRRTANLGHLMAVRRTSTRKLNRRAYGSVTPGYVCYQMGDYHSSEQLSSLLKQDLKQEGVQQYEVVAEHKWEYMPFFKPSALKQGLVQTMKDLQGQNHCWYTSSIFSHESIRNIVDFNAQLLPQILGNS